MFKGVGRKVPLCTACQVLRKLRRMGLERHDGVLSLLRSLKIA